MKIKGLFTFNVITWNVFFRIPATVAVGALATLALWILLYLTLWGMFKILEIDKDIPTFGFEIWLLVFFAICAVGQIPSEPETVPETEFVALVTWLGMPLWRILRRTGKYGWTGEALGFGRTKKVLGTDKGEFTDDKGFIKFGDIPFKVWDQGDSTIPDRTVIKAPAKNRAEVKATLTLILRIVNPKKTLDSDDPALDIGERARQEYREMTGCFTDTDIPSLQQVTGNVLTGTPLITSFVPKAHKGHKYGSMIRDNGGKAMFMLVPEGTSKHDAIAKFRKDVLKRADQDMLKLITAKDGSGNLIVKVDTVEVKDPIHEVIEAVGMKLERVTFGNISFSEPVQEAADKASAEEDERTSQLASANTQRDVRQRLLPTEEELRNPAWETVMVLAAAQDDKTDSVRLIHVTGGDKFTRAAAAAGQSFGGKS